MSERKIVKLRVDMYSDTKFKIIDTMEERDVIHYIWTRLLTLAGKVNLEGHLYLSKSIPYTIETLALEFNRSALKVELALKVFMDLEMIELTKGNVYRVKNFVKHQNIKSKKKADILEKEKCVEAKSNEIDFVVNKEDADNKDSEAEKSKCNGEKFSNGIFIADKESIDNTEGIGNEDNVLDKSSYVNSIMNKEIIENENNYVLEDKAKDKDPVVHNKSIKTTEILDSKDLRVYVNDKLENIKCDLDIKKDCEVKNNNEEIDKCIEFTDGINKSQFDNDDTDNNSGVEDKREVLENIKNEVNIKKDLYRKKDIDVLKNSLETENSKLNNIKVINFESTPKTDIDLKDGIRIKDNMNIKYDNIDNSVLVQDIDKLESTNNTKSSVDKSNLDKNLLGNEVNLEDKVNVEKEFVLSKGSSKKKKRKPKKKDNDVYVISDWEDDDNIELCKDNDSTELCEDGKNNEELCEFGDKIPEGEVITLFKF
ncbi:phage replisome organizer N-terminal domain-containing protein [Clostridium sp. YB-6]|uniref:Phage replisome organizer N-terminal domain-containing protein n=1 Tax=Clostridium weizhouense TaxID=2859781 RepID=A0ABS7ASB0_9CLOT|nr:phage replisome organizer N-terminal domain-containing protein [Clostridium weizhouense]MBW6411563.1 phage replisome organizer N-terminal domain-containing protein [Clostridium weizhouense]